MNTKETQKEPLESGETDIIGKIKTRSQTAKIASAISGAVLALLPVSTKAEPLGIKLDSDYENVSYGTSNEQLSPGTTKDRFKMTFEGPVDDWTGTIFGKEFRVKNNKNDGVVIEILSKSVVENNCLPSNEPVTCFYIMNADGTIKHTVAFSPGIIVDGQQKWSTCEIPDSIHPSKDKEEIKLVKSTGVSGVFRVPIESSNYCVDKVKDEKENTPWEELKAPETKDLLSLTFYKPKEDVVKTRLLARDSNGDLIGLNRNSDGTWIAVTGQQDKDDFPEQDPMSMLERETLDGRKVIIIMTYNPIDTNRIYVLEKHPDWTPENPKWNEVPATVKAVYETDPSFVLDDDGDGVPNSVEEASGGCIGYTDADKVDVNADGDSDTCQLECESYANEYGGTLTPSDALPCASNLGYESAKQLKDGSTLHYNGTAPVLGDDGTIIAQSSSKLRYIHSTLVGAVDAPELARDVALPDGYEAEIKVNSGTAHVSGFDFLGEPVEFTVTPESGLVDLGFVYGAEVGVEGSDIEITVGNEYQPCGVAVCGNQNPEPPAAEPAQTVDEPMAQADEGQSQAEIPTTAEPPPSQVELPTQAEIPMPQPEPAVVELVPDAYSAPDAKSETAEETGGVIVPPAEPMPEPTAEPIAEPVPDAVSVAPDADANIAEEAGSVIVPPVDATVSSPETDTAVYVDVPTAGTDTSPDTLQNPEASQDTQPTETLLSLDSAPDSTPDIAEPFPDSLLSETDNGGGTDVPVQGEDSQKDTLSGNPDKNQPDASQSQPDTNPTGPDANPPAGKDTENPQPKPENKNGGEGGSGGCAIENPSDPSTLNALMALGAGIAARVLKRRQRIWKVLR